MLTRSGSDLRWRFDGEGGAELRLPVGSWVVLGDRSAALTELAVSGTSATASYEGGRLTLRLSLEVDPADGALVQSVELSATAAVPDLLLDVRAVPVLADALEWLTVPGLFYGDDDLGGDRVDSPRGVGRDRSSRADASPCPGVHLAAGARGHAAFLERDRAEITGVATGASGHWEVLGVGWVHAADGARAVRFTLPAQEEPPSSRTPDHPSPPCPSRLGMPPGAAIRFRILHYLTPGGRGGYHRAARAMAARHRPAAPAGRRDPDGRPPGVRLRETADLLARCLRESCFPPDVGSPRRGDPHDVHSGLTGWLAAVEAGLLWGDAAPDPALRSEAEATADFVCATGVSPLGYFQAEHRLGRWWPGASGENARGLHVRHAVEGSLLLARLLRREAAAGRGRPAWIKALQQNLDAAVRDQRADGAWPIELDPATGEELDWEGATPGAWAGALAMGAALAAAGGDISRTAMYLDAAERGAAHTLERYVEAERFFGGSGDARRAPNPEDASLLLTSYAELHRLTQDQRWLDGAVRCADHLLAWRCSHDVEPPAGTGRAREAVSTCGHAPAAVRDRHLERADAAAAPALADLSTWTGDPWYRQAALDHLIRSCHLVARGDGALDPTKVAVALPVAELLTALALLGPG